MHPTHNLFQVLAHASFVVQCVMLTLLATSVFSWTLIFKRWHRYHQLKRCDASFQKQWRATQPCMTFYQNAARRTHDLEGLAKSCFEGMHAWHTSTDPLPERIAHLQRVMTLTSDNTLEPLYEQVGLLATIGSVSPYIGLFGTVWGMITALSALGLAAQATIAMVAPGIAEALIATAMGLFTAIPAVVAYNLFVQQCQQLSEQHQQLQQQLITLLTQQMPTQGQHTHDEEALTTTG